MANPLTSRLLDQKFRSEMKKRDWEILADDQDEISFFDSTSNPGVTKTAGFVKDEGYFWKKEDDVNDDTVPYPDDFWQEPEVRTEHFKTMGGLLKYIDYGRRL